MAYMNLEVIKEAKKVVRVSTPILQLRKLFEEIEETKRQLVRTENNTKMPYVIKTKRLETLRLGLFLLEHRALQLVQDEVLKNYNDDCGDGDGHDK